MLICMIKRTKILVEPVISSSESPTTEKGKRKRMENRIDILPWKLLSQVALSKMHNEVSLLKMYNADLDISQISPLCSATWRGKERNLPNLHYDFQSRHLTYFAFSSVLLFETKVSHWDMNGLRMHSLSMWGQECCKSVSLLSEKVKSRGKSASGLFFLSREGV